MRYGFLVETYETEIQKVLSVWSMFNDADLSVRPHSTDSRGRNLREHMVHQCVSENLCFETMLGIAVTGDPLPAEETRLGFLRSYAANAAWRLLSLRAEPDAWWEEESRFFEVRRTRASVMVRRIAHTAHHRGQQTTLLRMINHELHSTYGPTADTGGLMQNHAPAIYAYPEVETMLREEADERRKKPLPGPGKNAPTERPEPA